MMSGFKNKRGDIESMLYIVVMLFVIAIAFLFISNLNHEIFTELQSNINGTYEGTVAVSTLSEVSSKDQVIWDYAFIGVFVGCLLAVGLSAWGIRVSPIFFWIYVLMSMFILGAGVILSNVWQDVAADADFASTIARFPMTNMLLGSYYPLVVVAIMIISLGLLFGKPPQE